MTLVNWSFIRHLKEIVHHMSFELKILGDWQFDIFLYTCIVLIVCSR
jgi:hypothetical protein